MSRAFRQLMLMVSVTFLTARPALACSVCYGDPESPMSTGLTWAVGVLAGMITLVLVAVAAFFIHLSRRANQVPAATAAGNSCS